VANSAVQYLKAGETKTETFTVKSIDGTSRAINVVITGVNDAPAIAGDDAGALIEDASTPNLTDTGTLSITDPDTAEAKFQTSGISASAGALGALSITDAGVWSYSVANSAVQYLKAGETKTETFTVKSIDGTSRAINVVITGIEISVPSPASADAPSPIATLPEPAPEPLPATEVARTTSVFELNSGSSVTTEQTESSGRNSASIADVRTSPSGFQIAVIEAAAASLKVFNGITDQFIEPQKLTTFSLPADAFVHTREDATVMVMAKLADGRDLPDWIQFDARSGTFQIDATNHATSEEIQIKVTARDSDGREASTIFKISVGVGKTKALGRSSLSEQIKLAASRSSPWLDFASVWDGRSATDKLSSKQLQSARALASSHQARSNG
jgi:VCBS repeat-containing protein